MGLVLFVVSNILDSRELLSCLLEKKKLMSKVGETRCSFFVLKHQTEINRVLLQLCIVLRRCSLVLSASPASASTAAAAAAAATAAAAAVVSAVVGAPTKECAHPYSMMYRRLTTAVI